MAYYDQPPRFRQPRHTRTYPLPGNATLVLRFDDEYDTEVEIEGTFAIAGADRDSFARAISELISVYSI